MASTFFLAGTALVLLVTGCSSAKPGSGGQKLQDNIPPQAPVTIAHTANAGLRIDGDISDWRVPTAMTDHGTGISTSLQADSVNLYIAMHVVNQATQMKILQMGMQLYLDTGNGKSQMVYIGYPVVDQNQDAMMPAPKPGAPDNRSFKQVLIQQAVMLQTKGLQGFRDGMHLKKNAGGPSAALGEDGNNNLVYEASIPLKVFFGNAFRYKGEALPFSVGCTINGFTKKEQGVPDPEFTGGNPQGSGFGGGRGRMGNGRSGYSGFGQNMNKNIHFWISASLQ